MILLRYLPSVEAIWILNAQHDFLIFPESGDDTPYQILLWFPEQLNMKECNCVSIYRQEDPFEQPEVLWAPWDRSRNEHSLSRKYDAVRYGRQIRILYMFKELSNAWDAGIW